MTDDDLTPPHWGADAIPAVTPAPTLAEAVKTAIAEAEAAQVAIYQGLAGLEEDKDDDGARVLVDVKSIRAICRAFNTLRRIAEGGE